MENTVEAAEAFGKAELGEVAILEELGRDIEVRNEKNSSIEVESTMKTVKNYIISIFSV